MSNNGHGSGARQGLNGANARHTDSDRIIETAVTSPVETTDHHSDFFYLKHVTVGEILKDCGGAFWLWLFLSIGSIVLGIVFDKGSDAVVNGIGASNAVPRGLWVCAVVAVLSWLLRGKSFAFRFPKLSFVGWLFLNLLCAALASGWLPLWILSPIVYAFIPYSVLVETGKANYVKTNALANHASA